MNPRIKMALIERRNQGSGTYRAGRDGRFTRVYPGMEEGVPESRFRDSRGREHYDNGRYAPMKDSYPDWDDGSGMDTPHVPPVYGRHMNEEKEGQSHPKNVIGFTSRNAGKPEEPMSYDEGMAWVKAMKNADGTTGAHWTIEQTNQAMEQQKINCDELDFYITMNMMYSDYCKVAKKFNCSTVEFYACMAKAFLEDKDAQGDKLSRYYEYIAKH